MDTDSVKQYSVSLDKDSEPILRSYLLDYADTFRITRAEPWMEVHFFKINKFGTDDDPKLIAGQQTIRKDLFRKVASHKRYNDVYMGKRRRFIHQYYKLSVDLKQILNQETLGFGVESKTFYGYEDPTFYRGDQMLCSTMTLKGKIICNFTPSQVKLLMDKGLKLAPVR